MNKQTLFIFFICFFSQIQTNFDDDLQRSLHHFNATYEIYKKVWNPNNLLAYQEPRYHDRVAIKTDLLIAICRVRRALRTNGQQEVDITDTIQLNYKAVATATDRLNLEFYNDPQDNRPSSRFLVQNVDSGQKAVRVSA